MSLTLKISPPAAKSNVLKKEFLWRISGKLHQKTKLLQSSLMYLKMGNASLLNGYFACPRLKPQNSGLKYLINKIALSPAGLPLSIKKMSLKILHWLKKIPPLNNWWKKNKMQKRMRFTKTLILVFKKIRLGFLGSHFLSRIMIRNKINLKFLVPKNKRVKGIFYHQ